MKKIILYVFSALAALVILIGLAGVLHAMRLVPDLKQARTETTAGNEVPLGGKVDCRVTLTLPLVAPKPEMSVTPPANTVLGGPVKVTRGRYLWNRCEWTLSCVLRSYKAGAATDGRMSVHVRGRFPAEATFPIPDFVVTPVKAGAGEPDLAGAMPKVPAKHPWRWVVLGIVLAALAAWGVVAWLKRPRAASVPLAPPWERAERDLEKLEADVAGERTALGTAFVRLTDLVRRYLEERYRLPVTSRTTDEFMRDMRDDSPLPDAEQPFLRDFLSSADLVKFAKMPPDKAMFSRSADGARTLFRNTAAEKTEEVKHV